MEKVLPSRALCTKDDELTWLATEGELEKYRRDVMQGLEEMKIDIDDVWTKENVMAWRSLYGCQRRHSVLNTSKQCHQTKDQQQRHQDQIDLSGGNARVRVEELHEEDEDVMGSMNSMIEMVCSFGMHMMAYPEYYIQRNKRIPWVVVDSTNALIREIDRFVSDCVLEFFPVMITYVCEKLTAYVDYQESLDKSTVLHQYQGPDTWERTQKAAQLVWMVHRIELTWDDIEIVVPTWKKGIHDVCSAVRNFCMLGMEYVIVQRPEVLSSQRRSVKDVIDVVRQSIQGCDGICCFQTYHLVASCVRTRPSLESELIPEALDGALRHQNDIEYSISWMSAMRYCFTAVGVPMVRYTSTLLPLLIAWGQSSHIQVQQHAFLTMVEFLKATYPRNRVHADAIWDVLVRVYEREGGLELIDKTLLESMGGVSLILWVSAGPNFRRVRREASHDYFVQYAKTHCDTG